MVDKLTSRHFNILRQLLLIGLTRYHA